jgi:hypothetical protein
MATVDAASVVFGLPPRGERDASHDPPARPLPTRSAPWRKGARRSTSRSESFVQVAMGEVVDLNRALWPAFSFFPRAVRAPTLIIILSSRDVRRLPVPRENPSFREATTPMRRTSRSALPAPGATSGLGHRRSETPRRFSAFGRHGSDGPGTGTDRGSRRLPPR